MIEQLEKELVNFYMGCFIVVPITLIVFLTYAVVILAKFWYIILPLCGVLAWLVGKGIEWSSQKNSKKGGPQ